MVCRLSGFRQFVEDETRSLKASDGKGDKGKESYIGAMGRELSISPNDIPAYIESGPISFDNIFYNQAIWKVIKPIDDKDEFVRIQFHKSLSPNINQRAYRKLPNGKMEPYEGDPNTSIHMISMDELAKMLGRDWETLTQQQQQGGQPPPMMGGM